MANYLSAYQISKPQQDLKSGLIGLGKPTLTEARLQKAMGMEHIQELLSKAWESSGKTARKGKPFTDILDIASMAVDPITSAILGAFSGLTTGIFKKKAGDRLTSKINRLAGTQQGYKKATYQEHLAAAKEKKMNTGDVLLEGGTKALQNFAMGKLGESLGGSKSLTDSLTKYKPKGASWIENLKKGEKAFNFKNLQPMDYMSILPMFQQSIASTFEDPGEEFKMGYRR